MDYKTVLTVTTISDPAETTLTGAAQICARNDGHLDVLALGVDRSQVGYSYLTDVAVVVQLSMEQAEAEARSVEAAARAVLAEQPDGLRWSLESAVSQTGMLGGLVAQRARFADLVVLAQPYGPKRGVEAEAVLEAALFDGMAPVLVLPVGVAPDARAPRRIVIAWNQSREAMMAVRAALPMLKEADLVNIAVIDPSSHGSERSDPGGALCQMLVRHGVKAEVSVLARTLPRVSDVLVRHLADMDADLLVMGAYGHSRFREALLGGATRDMLELAKVPMLLAH